MSSAYDAINEMERRIATGVRPTDAVAEVKADLDDATAIGVANLLDYAAQENGAFGLYCPRSEISQYELDRGFTADELMQSHVRGAVSRAAERIAEVESRPSPADSIGPDAVTAAELRRLYYGPRGRSHR